jgi:hypothetical protein
MAQSSLDLLDGQAVSRGWLLFRRQKGQVLSLQAPMCMRLTAYK